MKFALKSDERLGSGLRRIARKVLRAGIDELRDNRRAGDAIHAARKSVKKVRALVALAETRGDRRMRDADKRLRRAGHRLSAVRDARAIADSFDRICDRFPHATRRRTAIARALRKRVRECEQAAVAADLAADVARALRAARRRLGRSELDAAGQATVAAGVERAYRRSCRAFKKAEARQRVDDLHRWRRRVKTLWYQLRLLRSRWPSPRLVSALGKIEEWLGEDHNVALLRERLAEDNALGDAAADGEFDRACERYAGELRRKAIALGTRICRRDPKVFVRQLRRTAAAKKR